jgi:hypothetical protein
MRRGYKRISWLVNGVMIGLIVAGLMGRSFTILLIGALAGLAVAVLFKAVSWLRQRSEG